MISLRRWLTVRAWWRKVRNHPWWQMVGTELNYHFRRETVTHRLLEVSQLPRGLHVEATNICNAKCVFCAYPQMERAKASLPMDLFGQVVDQYVEAGGSHVSLTPVVGDPFVDKLLFERLDDLSLRPSIRGFYFFTNAILMDSAASRHLVAYGSRLRVCVSMGGFDRETFKRLMGVDRFDVVWKNLRAFVEEASKVDEPARLEIHLRCAVGDLRGAAWLEVEDWRRRGLVEVAAVDAYDSWAGKIDDGELRRNGLRPMPRAYRRGACELLYMKPVVLADGRVNACACRDVEAELVIGDVREQGLAEIFRGDALESLRRRHEVGDYPDVCRRCTYYVSVFNPLVSRIADDVMSWDK